MNPPPLRYGATGSRFTQMGEGCGKVVGVVAPRWMVVVSFTFHLLLAATRASRVFERHACE